MKTMDRARLSANLEKRCQELTNHMAAPGLPGLATPSLKAEKLSRKIHLSHGIVEKRLPAACKQGSLISKAAFHLANGTGLSPATNDVILGTAHCVFCYAGPFRYPSSQCGFLFSYTLEDERSHDGAASPFDSGGLMSHIGFPFEFGSAPHYLQNHEFPIPEHRQYLQLVLDNLFAQPEHYIDGTPPEHANCLGLSGGDERMWTHEVRIPDSISLVDRHLRAVFLSSGLHGSNTEIEEFVLRCESKGIDCIKFDSPRRGDFKVLKSKCVEYLQEKLY